jgi:hypothetical protein
LLGLEYAQKVRKHWGITHENLDSHRWLPSPVRPSPIDPFEQHRELRTGQGDLATLGLRPHKSSALQPLREQAKAVAIEPEQLDQIAKPNDIPHTDRSFSLSSILGIHFMESGFD